MPKSALSPVTKSFFFALFINKYLFFLVQAVESIMEHRCVTPLYGKPLFIIFHVLLTNKIC